MAIKGESITIKKGESKPIYITLKQDGVILTPDMITDLKVCIGTYSQGYRKGGVRFDDQTQEWWIFPRQMDTLAMEEGSEMLCVQLTYHNDIILELEIGRVNIKHGYFEEEF